MGSLLDRRMLGRMLVAAGIAVLVVLVVVFLLRGCRGPGVAAPVPTPGAPASQGGELLATVFVDLPPQYVRTLALDTLRPAEGVEFGGAAWDRAERVLAQMWPKESVRGWLSWLPVPGDQRDATVVVRLPVPGDTPVRTAWLQLVGPGDHALPDVSADGGQTWQQVEGTDVVELRFGDPVPAEQIRVRWTIPWSARSGWTRDDYLMRATKRVAIRVNVGWIQRLTAAFPRPVQQVALADYRGPRAGNLTWRLYGAAFEGSAWSPLAIPGPGEDRVWSRLTGPTRDVLLEVAHSCGRLDADDTYVETGRAEVVLAGR